MDHAVTRSEPVRVVHYGLGPIGLEIARLVAQRRSLDVVGAIDIDPELTGKDLGELLDGPPSGVMVAATEACLGLGAVGVVTHSTGSSLERVLPQLLACVEAGLSVVSTCEELSYPWEQAPELAEQLDQVASRKGVTVLGTGVN